MKGVNKAIILGNIGQDPSIRALPNGNQVVTISVATSESWKDQSGEKQEKTEWHRVNFFGKLAEIAGNYLTKGMAVYIEGKIVTNKYTDKNGIERYTTSITANEMQMLSRSDDKQSQHKNQSPQSPSNNILDEGLPF